tara:strand:- start:66 stop:287 length:222 start_codon:yes stop_codon:yes gene_type:complete
MSRNIARKLEERHDILGEEVDGNIVSFVIKVMKLQQDMLTEIERLNERLEHERSKTQELRQRLNLKKLVEMSE